MTAAPALSCILTVTAGEGARAAHSLRGLLALAGALEVMVIDHGADAGTRAMLAGLSHPQLRLVRMAPSPRGAARNRGLALAQGARLCVLTPGDTLAPFGLTALVESDADCLFLPAALRGEDGMVAPTGQPVFDWLAGAGLDRADTSHERFAQMLTRLALLPHQPALRVVRRGLVRDHALSFAHEADSGWLFATGALMNAQSLAVAPLPSVTLWQEAGPEATRGTGFETLSDAAQALHLFERARHFHDPVMRAALLGAVFHPLAGLMAALPADAQQALGHASRLVLARLDARLVRAASVDMRAGPEATLAPCAPWLGAALEHAQVLCEPPASPLAPKLRQSAIARLAAWARGSSETS